MSDNENEKNAIGNEKDEKNEIKFLKWIIWHLGGSVWVLLLTMASLSMRFLPTYVTAILWILFGCVGLTWGYLLNKLGIHPKELKVPNSTPKKVYIWLNLAPVFITVFGITLYILVTGW